MSGQSVFQDWYSGLSMQQQSVLVLACRGPDGVGKYHPTKPIVAHYRATVLKAAYYGRPMQVGEEAGDNTFMSLQYLGSDKVWRQLVQSFFDNVDSLPHHYYMHLMHGAQIAGYKHSDKLFRQRWGSFYLDCCADLHLDPETELKMDRRLGDWDQKHWSEA
jgi:hypothetical protein